MKKDHNWPIIAAIVICVLAVIVAIALALTMFITFPKNTEDKAKETDQKDPVVADKVPEEEPDAELDEYDPESRSKYNVLLMGVDASGALTDVIMIYQIDPQNNKINVLSIPRDTKVTYNNRTEKINAVHSYGSRQKDAQGGDRGDEYAIKFIRELTGIPIHHYMCINTTAFRQIIDELGGFDFDVPRDMDYDDNYQDLHIHLKKGYQHLDGDKAEQLVRFRRYTNGDIDRVKMQQSVLRALIEQKVNINYVSKVPSIFSIIRANVSTDMTASEVAALANDVLYISGESADNVSIYTADGSFGDSGGVSYWGINTSKLKELVKNTFGYVDGQPAAQ